MDDRDDALSLSWLPTWTPIGCRIFISASVNRRKSYHSQRNIVRENLDPVELAGSDEGSNLQRSGQGQIEEKLHVPGPRYRQLQHHLKGSIEDALASRDPPLPVVPVEALTTSQSHQVVVNVLESISKHLTEPQMKLLLKKHDSTSALYLCVCIEELRLGGDFGLDGQMINQMIAAFPEQLEALFDQVLERIEHELDVFCNSHHAAEEKERLINGYHRHSDEGDPARIHGSSIVEHALSLLVCSRNGLYESDLLKMICPKNWIFGESLPPIIWSRIYHAIEPYLASVVSAGRTKE